MADSEKRAMQLGTDFQRHEVSSAYVDDRFDSTSSRFVVSFIVGFGESVGSAHEAARAALELTREPGCLETRWFVFDRATGTMHELDQKDFDDAGDDAARAEGGGGDAAGLHDDDDCSLQESH